MAAPKRLKIGSGRQRLRMSMSSKGIAEAKGKLGRVQRKLVDLRPVLKVGAIDIETLMANCFENQADPSGNEWRDLTIATKDARARRGKKAMRRDEYGDLTEKAIQIREERWAAGFKILWVTGVHLKNKMFARAKNRSIEFGSNSILLKYHQLGTKNKNGSERMVARMIAPVEKRGSNWALIRRGPAQSVFTELENQLRKYIAFA